VKASELKTVFMGTPDFAVGTLQGLIDAGVDLIGVYTQPDRPKGRGKKLSPPPVKELALEHGIPVFQPQKLRAPEAVAELQQLAPDLIVVVAYGQILPQSVLDIPQQGCINVHASLLPKYRGAAPINKAIVDGETVTGITTMLMDAGLDTGDMLVKKSLEIGPDETAGGLHERLAVLGRETMEETLQQVLDGKLSPEKQQDDDSTYAPMMKKEDGLIDWSLSAQEIHDRVRGLAPWPGAFTMLDGDVLKISCTGVSEGAGEPGVVLVASASGVDVACGDGVVRIGALQLPGKKMLPAADFLRGHQLTEGQKLG
jgi:methionyl-tRNA formyltransferase